MSRSYKHTPIVGMTNAPSDKTGKTEAHRRNRSRARTVLVGALRTNPEDLAACVVPEKLTANPWHWEKDGKQYLSIELRERCGLERGRTRGCGVPICRGRVLK